jgi:hypothetical protein
MRGDTLEQACVKHGSIEIAKDSGKRFCAFWLPQ